MEQEYGMRRILITNDDGITAGGIVRLAEAAREFGEVWIVAPAHQRSAASHSISLHSPIDVMPHDFPVEGVRAFACSGTPADCVRVGSLNVMPEKPYAVLSGINYGYNAASDIQYSATAGAAFEGAFQGYLSIALSEDACDCHEVTAAYLRPVLEKLLRRMPPAGAIWNVNFPGCPLAECRGLLEDRTDTVVQEKRHRLQLLVRTMEGLSPIRKLQQGYSYAEDDSGHNVAAIGDVQQGDTIHVEVTDGVIHAEVTGTQRRKRPGKD